MLAPSGGAANTFGNPIPVFHLSRQQALGEDPLGAARQTGWRFLVTGPQNSGFVEVHANTEGTQPRYGGLTHGVLPQRLYDACVLAERQLAKTKVEYEPRILDVPSMQFVSLWLHGQDEPYISLLDGSPAGSARLDLSYDLASRVKAQMSSRPPAVAPAAGAPPSN